MNKQLKTPNDIHVKKRMSLLACFKLHWFIDCSVLKLNPTMFFPLGFSDISCRIFLWTFSFISCGPRGGGRNSNARLAVRSYLMPNQWRSKFLFWLRSVSNKKPRDVVRSNLACGTSFRWTFGKLSRQGSKVSFSNRNSVHSKFLRGSGTQLQTSPFRKRGLIKLWTWFCRIVRM